MHDNCDKLVFWTPDNSEFGIFFTLHHFEIVDNYSFALQNSQSWGEFWENCNPETRAFCERFLETDERTPNNKETLSELEEEIFILGDAEFPLAQCAEESTSYMGLNFMKEYIFDTINTEYGEKINLYTTINTSRLLSDIGKSGFSVQEAKKPFPFPLFRY